MIFERYIGFLDEFSVDVEVFTSSGNLIGEATFTVGKNTVPRIEFEIFIDLSKYSKNKTFICKSNKYTYQIMDCDVLENTIFPRFMIRGKRKRSKIKKVHLLFQGISQWMSKNGKFEFTDSEIIKTRDTKGFKAKIDLEERKFSLYSERWCDTKYIGENSHQINEYTILTIEAKNFSWFYSDLISIISDIRTFFTLILGHSIGLEYVLDATDKDMTQSIYFLNATRVEGKDILPRECFVQSDQILSNDKWQEILQGYFSYENAKYRKVWSRIAGMLSYEGFWEYRILAYVSLIDRYVSIYSEKEEKYLPNKQFRKYRRVAREALKTSSEEVRIKDEKERNIFDSVISSMCQQINQNIQNSSISSFNDKFDLKINNTDSTIIGILNFNSSDFNHLKRIRNCVAHGDEPIIRSDSDITYEDTITNKLSLLLRYWTFIDIGFSSSDFIDYLGNWMYSITQQARINKESLDIASGCYQFLEVNKTNFNKAKKHKNSCLVFDYVKTSNTLRVNTSATNHLKRWSLERNKKNRSVEEELMEQVDTTTVNNIAYLNFLYLKYQNELLNVSGGACILNCPESISSSKQVKDRLRVFDTSTNEWLPSEFEKRILLAKERS